jgi:broad specificity phosphatase PhoE
MLIFVRHAKTESNDPVNERLRGTLPIPLTVEGMKQARETAESLAEVEDVKSLYSSTLVRVVQSAHEISQVLSIEMEPLEELDDWDTGDFQGQLAKDVMPQVLDYIRNPTKKVPGGEAFKFYQDKIVPKLREFVESDDVCVMVGSGRASTMLKALAVNKGGEPDLDILLKKPPVEPGGIMILNADWDITFMTKKSEEMKDVS